MFIEHAQVDCQPPGREAGRGRHRGHIVEAPREVFPEESSASVNHEVPVGEVPVRGVFVHEPALDAPQELPAGRGVAGVQGTSYYGHERVSAVESTTLPWEFGPLRCKAKLIPTKELHSKRFERGLHPLIKETVIGTRIRIYTGLVLVLPQPSVSGHLLGCWGSPGVKRWVLLPMLIEGRKGKDKLVSQSNRGTNVIQYNSVSFFKKKGCQEADQDTGSQIARNFSPHVTGLSLSSPSPDTTPTPMTTAAPPCDHQQVQHPPLSQRSLPLPLRNGSYGPYWPLFSFMVTVAPTGQQHRTPGGVKKGRAYAMWPKPIPDLAESCQTTDDLRYFLTL
ncbi:hypothetical protein Acr_06g0007590 [Actinidia rufa]|uniref:Uncharacterized protein n=1 Tax=Actinidia rufa TaxID=165716 RepID=A0A7J0ES49_9ERIC|nr:hypothetical protein Acr_06g0007590 [Actinidia rufa]